jgi:DNA-3-methyladenine glycosylase II
MPTATELFTTSGTLTPRAPFDFVKTLAFFRMFTPMSDEQTIVGDALTKAISVDGRAVAFTVRNSGSADAPQLSYTLAAEQPLDEGEIALVRDRISFFLSLDDDLQPFYAIATEDTDFAPIIQRLYGLHQPKFLTPFEIACWAVLAQRMPMPIARRIKARIFERYGTSIALNGVTYRAFPEPAQLAAADPLELAGIVRNERKCDYLNAVIQFFAGVDEQFLRTGPIAEVAARIRGIRGIGEWSTHFILVRGLGRMEQLSNEEPEMLKAAARIYNGGQPLTTAQFERLRDRYGNQQGYWAFYARNAMLGSSSPTEE